MSKTSIDELLIEIPKGRGEVYRIRLAEYRGRPFVDIRTWYPDDEGQFKPGKGASLRPDVLPAVIAALQDAQRRLCAVTT